MNRGGVAVKENDGGGRGNRDGVRGKRKGAGRRVRGGACDLAVIEEVENPADQFSGVKRREKGWELEEMGEGRVLEEQEETLRRVAHTPVNGRIAANEFGLEESKQSSCQSQTLTGAKRERLRQLQQWREQEREIKRPQKPLREQFAHLLPGTQTLKIGHSHKKLIQTMTCLDRYLSFLTSRGQVCQKFQTIQRGIKESMKVEVTIRSLKQLMFLNSEIYRIGYQKSEGDYEMMLGFVNNQVQKQETRRANLRDNIVCYLKMNYEKHLQGRRTSLPLDEIRTWEYGFQPNAYDIPQAQLPPQPLELKRPVKLQDQRSETTSCLITRSLIERIANKNQASLREEASREILLKKGVSTFREKLENMVREKEAELERERKKVREEPKGFCKTQLTQFCEQACQLFIERGVNNIFCSSFITMMTKRMQSDRMKIESMLNEVLPHESKFLVKMIVSSNSLEMIRIDQDQYRSIKESYEAAQ